ncbi:MAG: hypothetical protein K0S12_1277 [Bacteroidetes bacterium]|nr:hypothetical protein [Bacteroidota bacterium]
MLRKDLIVRQFEEFGKVLAKILSHKKALDWDSFQKEIEEAAKKFTAFEISAVEDSSLTEFQSAVFGKENMTYDRTKILASLLFEKMSFYAEQNDALKAENLKNKCILLYEKCASDLMDNEYDLDVHYKLQFLKSK